MSSFDTIVVHRGAQKHEIRPNLFFSSCPDFAADYGEVRDYEISLSGVVIDTRDADHIRPLLPLHDPYDGSEIHSIDDYMERISDTWEIIEAVVDRMQFDVLVVTEGAVVNYLVRNPALVTPIRTLSPTP